MRIRSDKLAGRLIDTIDPVYVVSGEEPLLVDECLDLIRQSLRQAGYCERIVFWVERGFDWSRLDQEAASMSLFAARRIIELRLTSAKPGEAGSRVLREYAARPLEDTVLVLSAPRLDKSAMNSKWIRGLDSCGVLVQVWPVDEADFPAWLAQRMTRHGLEPDRDALAALAHRVEGNLLAAQQEVEKLWLQKGAGRVSVEDVEAQVGDSARFDVFKLADSAVAGAQRKALRILGSLRMEGTEPVLVAWALTREIRALAGMRQSIDRGKPVQAVIAAARVWGKRQGIVRAALNRHSSDSLQRLLIAAGHADRVIKGRTPGTAWEAVLGLVTGLAGSAAQLQLSA